MMAVWVLGDTVGGREWTIFREHMAIVLYWLGISAPWSQPLYPVSRETEVPQLYCQTRNGAKQLRQTGCHKAGRLVKEQQY